MTQTICSRIEFALLSNIQMQVYDFILLLTGKSWKNIESNSQPIYSKQQDDSDAGKLNSESVKFSCQSTLNDLLKSYSDLGQQIIVRCYTSNGSFIVGSTVYPLTITYSDDKSVRSFTFSCKNPAK